MKLDLTGCRGRRGRQRRGTKNQTPGVVMTELLKTLVKLQDLELGGEKGREAGSLKTELRAKIPPPILLHYDRLIARGKKGITAVRNQICTGCHMQVPLGVVMTLMCGTDIQLCDNCGRYLYLPEGEGVSAPAPAPEVKAPAKPRKKKAAAKSS